MHVEVGSRQASHGHDGLYVANREHYTHRFHVILCRAKPNIVNNALHSHVSLYDFGISIHIAKRYCKYTLDFGLDRSRS